MKKQILSFALVAVMIGSVAAGCSSTKNASGADSTGTVTDTTHKMAPDTMVKDTTKPDTTKKPPM